MNALLKLKYYNTKNNFDGFITNILFSVWLHLTSRTEASLMVLKYLFSSCAIFIPKSLKGNKSSYFKSWYDAGINCIGDIFKIESQFMLMNIIK